jgi:hypothetical protein
MTTEEELVPDRSATERATPEEPSLSDSGKDEGTRESEAEASSPTPAVETEAPTTEGSDFPSSPAEQTPEQAEGSTEPEAEPVISSHAAPSVILVNSDVIDRLGVVVLLSLPCRPPLLGALRLSFRLLPEPCGVATGNPRSLPSDRGSAALRETAETDPGGSTPMGLVMRGLEWLAVQCLPRPTRDSHRLAPQRVSLVLDLENSTWQARATGRAAGDPRLDSDDEPREPALGCAANPQ